MNGNDSVKSLSNIEQVRADDAWKRIDKIRQNPEQADHYATEAQKLPVRIMASSLGQALAFLFAKTAAKPPRGPAVERLIVDLSERVIGYLHLAPPANKVQTDSLIRLLIEGDTDVLRRSTDEALAWLQWLNRFAEGYKLKKEQ